MRIAFSRLAMVDGSKGCATISDGSGIESAATWFSGIFAP